jgi:hypothetical protein
MYRLFSDMVTMPSIFLSMGFRHVIVAGERGVFLEIKEMSLGSLPPLNFFSFRSYVVHAVVSSHPLD